MSKGSFTISPSQIPIIINGSPEQQADLFLIKTGRKEKPPRTEAMKWGILLEPVVLEHALSSYGVKDGIPQLKLVHPSVEYLYGYCDYWVEPEEDRGKFAEIYEIKTTRYPINVNRAIPKAWTLQIQAMLMMTGARNSGFSDFQPIKKCRLCCLAQTNSYTSTVILPDDKVQAEIIKATDAFYDCLVKDDLGAFTFNSSQLNHIYAEYEKGKVSTYNTGDDVHKAIASYNEANNRYSSVRAAKESSSVIIKSKIADAEKLVNAQTDEVAATWLKTKTGSRILRVKKSKEMT